MVQEERQRAALPAQPSGTPGASRRLDIELPGMGGAPPAGADDAAPQISASEPGPPVPTLLDALLTEARTSQGPLSAFWAVFVIGVALMIVWSAAVLVPGVALPPVPVVVAAMILATMTTISGAAMLLISATRPTARLEVAVEALEAKLRLETLIAEHEAEGFEIEERARAANEETAHSASPPSRPGRLGRGRRRA